MNGGRRRSPREGGDSGDILCCCEYINQRGERSHLVASVCDCNDLDQSCDRWISCQSVEWEELAVVMETVSDRCRVPWIRGAIKVDVTILPPLVLLPVSLWAAACHVLRVALLVSLPLLLICYYRLTQRRRGRSLLFLSLALFSLAYMYYTLVREVFLKGHMGRGHLCAITAGLVTTLTLLTRAKRDPGYLSSAPSGGSPRHQDNLLTGAKHDPGYFSSAPAEGSPRQQDNQRCKVCQLMRPARSGHCRMCGSCVLRLDHHCVWIDNCIGSGNHKSFIALLIVFIITAIYGISVTLRALCPGQNIAKMTGI
ncbi:LOW QUALITY PROTEIN: palmitoyltransferase ZDHHC23 [Mantella aurantiaca]